MSVISISIILMSVCLLVGIIFYLNRKYTRLKNGRQFIFYHRREEAFYGPNDCEDFISSRNLAKRLLSESKMQFVIIVPYKKGIPESAPHGPMTMIYPGHYLICRDKVFEIKIPKDVLTVVLSSSDPTAVFASLLNDDHMGKDIVGLLIRG